MDLEPGLQIDLLGALRRRAMLGALVAGGVFLLSYWVAMALPNRYESYATLLVEPQSVSDILVEAGAPETEVNSRLHIMTAQILSRPRLSRIIDELNLYQEESLTVSREDVIDLMRSRIRVVPVVPELEVVRTRSVREVEINTFQVYFSARTPNTAAQVAQRLANDFIEKHIAERVEMTQTSLEFIEAERARLENTMLTVEQRIARAKDANPGQLPEDFNANQRLLEGTISDLRQAQRQLDIARSDEAVWAHQVRTAGETARGPRDGASPSRKLELLELSVAELRARGFTDKHPDMLTTQLEIEALRQKVESGTAEEGDGPPTYAQQSAISERQRSTLRVQLAEREGERLVAQIEEIRNRMEATPRVAEQLDALGREHAQLSESLRDFANRHLEASVQANLERRQLGEQFRIVEPAFPPPSPNSPNRLVILVVGLFLGLALGGMTGVAVENFDTSLHAARDLQSAVKLPVFASIPAIVLDSDRADMNRRRLRYAAATMAVVVVCLFGGAASYVVVNGRPGWLTFQADGQGAQAPRPGAARTNDRASRG